MVRSLTVGLPPFFTRRALLHEGHRRERLEKHPFVGVVRLCVTFCAALPNRAL